MYINFSLSITDPLGLLGFPNTIPSVFSKDFFIFS